MRSNLQYTNPQEQEVKKLVPVLISKSPKTIVYIPSDLTNKARKKCIRRYMDEDGKMRIETAFEAEIVGLIN